MITLEHLPQFSLDLFLAQLKVPVKALSGVEISVSGTPPETQQAVRGAVRAGGFKPSGRNKPAWEYLRAAREKGAFPSINPLVDLANEVSVGYGLPISVLDGEKLKRPFEFRLGLPEESYVFNPSGQILQVEGLVGLADAESLAATPIKDCQRTKTSPDTTCVLGVVWGLSEEADWSRRCAQALRDGLKSLGADLEEVRLG